MRAVFLIALAVVCASGQTNNPATYTNPIAESMARSAAMKLEARRIELAEKETYLKALGNTNLTEAQLGEISAWILSKLQLYRPPKKSNAASDADLKFLMEILAARSVEAK